MVLEPNPSLFWLPFAHRGTFRSQLVEKTVKHANLHFNDLRGTAVTMLSEAGNTIQQVASVTGHSLKTVTSILEKNLARTRGLSDARTTKLIFENGLDGAPEEIRTPD